MSEQNITETETTTIVSEPPQKRTRRPKFATAEERLEANREKNRRWLKKESAKLYFRQYYKDHPERYKKKPKVAATPVV